MGRMRHALERPTVDDRALVESVRRSARPLQEGDLSGYDPLIDFVGDAHIALIGEASHGTHEFYRERALITSRLINELGFSFVAIEGDWPEASRVRQYVQRGPGTARCLERVQRLSHMDVGQSRPPPLRGVAASLQLLDRGHAQGWRLWTRPLQYESGNYVPTRLASRYDAYIHLDRTRAFKPLAIEPTWRAPAAEDTFPSGY